MNKELIQSGMGKGVITVVHHFIKLHPNCNSNDIGNYTKIKAQTITGKIAQLLDLGLIEVTSKGRYATYKIIGCETKQAIASRRRKEEKYIKIIRNLLLNYNDCITNQAEHLFNSQIKVFDSWKN